MTVLFQGIRDNAISMIVQSKSQLLALIAAHKEQLKAFGVKRFGIFGSFVRDEPEQESDVDVFVEFAPGQKTFDNFMHLAFYLEELFGRKVDLLTPESLSPYLGPEIVREVEYVPVGA